MHIDGIELRDESRTDALRGRTLVRWAGRRGDLNVYVRDHPETNGFVAFATIHATLRSGVRWDAQLPDVLGQTPEAAASLLEEVLDATRRCFNID